MLAAEEEAAEGRAYVAHEGFPFCEQCGSMLGVARPDLGLLEDAGDARCRTCGFLNLHGPGGRLLNDATVDLLELRPSAALWEQQAKDVDAFQATPRPSPRTKWTRRVPHLVLSGHAASLTPY